MQTKYYSRRYKQGKKLYAIIEEIKKHVEKPTHVQALVIELLRTQLVAFMAAVDTIKQLNDPAKIMKINIEKHATGIGRSITILYDLKKARSGKKTGNPQEGLYEKAMEDLMNDTA